MLLKSPTNTKLDRNRRILSMLDPRTDPTTRLAALDNVDKMLKEARLEWGDLAPLITPTDRLKKVYPGGVGLPMEHNYQRGFKIKQL